MRLNGQYLKSYSAYTINDLQEMITREWKSVYPDCKIVTISITYDKGYRALVVFVVFEEGDFE